MSRMGRTTGAYTPYLGARRPGGSPDEKPRFRVLVHHKYLEIFESLADRVGLQNAQRMWDHLAFSPDQPPKIGISHPLKGKHFKETPDGKSKVYHYEVSGAGRVNYRFHPAWKASQGDEHPVVWIIDINLDSH